jgi:hypothetical protein
MLAISDVLFMAIKPLVARMIYDPNESKTMDLIVDHLTRFAQEIPQSLNNGAMSAEDLQQYNTWLKEFL